MKVPGKTIRTLARRGIKAVVEPTESAVETYNRLKPKMEEQIKGMGK